MKYPDCPKSCMLKWEMEGRDVCIAELLNVPAGSCVGGIGYSLFRAVLLGEMAEAQRKLGEIEELLAERDVSGA